MNLSHKTYQPFDALRLMFKISPILSAVRVLMAVVQALIPTALMALATANFVDTALEILEKGRLRGDIYIPLALLLAALAAVNSFGSLVQLVDARLNLDLRRKLNPAVVKIQAALDFKHIEDAGSWEFITRVSRDPAGSLAGGFKAYMNFGRTVGSVAAVMGLILAQVWWAALVITAFSAPMFWLSVKTGKQTYKAGRDAEKFNRRTEYLEEVLMGRDNIDERTLFGYGGAISERWRVQFEAGRILQLKVIARRFLVTKAASLILALISLLIALTLIGPVTTGELSAGMFMGILSAVFGLIQQIGWQLSSSLEQITRVDEYVKDLWAFTALDKSAGALAEPDAEPHLVNRLEFRGVRFMYPSGGEYILDGLSFVLEGGRHYAFVGKNGAGKTTIAKLLTGLYTDYEGEILINGKELRQYAAGELKALFSVVYQDFAKYYISLADNIALGDAANSDARKKAAMAAAQAGLDETVRGLANGMDTPLGKVLEGGQDISGGQWQRVAIARSLASRAPVKILDEPTAALDPISESRIYEEFEKLMAGKTTVFISHRLGSTKLADEILVIGDGKIAERGTHDMLMAANGQYAEMFEAQRGWYQ
jgi:ATP-binding cassette subfamily B protein